MAPKTFKNAMFCIVLAVHPLRPCGDRQVALDEYCASLASAECTLEGRPVSLWVSLRVYRLVSLWSPWRVYSRIWLSLSS